jgi:alanine racemase
VAPGDEVVIIGAQGDDRIDVREMAAQIGTIPYEILCRIGSRIERVYAERPINHPITQSPGYPMQYG